MVETTRPRVALGRNFAPTVVLRPRLPGIATRAVSDPYAVLGISRAATAEDIKRAFKTKALKLHPDVNTAPDAAKAFVACREAYHAALDRVAQGSQQNWGPAVSSSERQRRRPTQPVYGFKDMMRDLKKEIAEAYSESKEKWETEPIRSLWEELEMAAEDFVSSMEQGLQDSQSKKRPAPTTVRKNKQPQETASAKPTLEDELEEMKRQLNSKPS